MKAQSPSSVAKSTFRSQGIYVDLGTENTLVYVRGAGWVLNEPSFVSFREGTRARTLLATGHISKAQLGRTPMNISVERPLREGVIANFYSTELMLRNFFGRLDLPTRFLRPEMIISLPCKVTEFERQAVEEVGRSLGARSVRLIDEPMAAAVGAGLAVTRPNGQIMVDIGGGTTEIAVISLGGVAYANAVRIGGHAMDDRIIQHLRNQFNILIGEPTAEKLKVLYSDAMELDETPIEFKGVDLASGLPRLLSIPRKEIHVAIEPVLQEMILAIKQALAETPPELASDIVENGIWLAGGGAMIRNLANRVSIETGVKTHVANEPLLSVAKGGAYLLDHPEILEKVS